MIGLGHAHALSLGASHTLAPPFVGPLDAFSTGLLAALSISRRLLSSYNGPLIRVRRSSDDAELDIGFTAAGLLDVVELLAFAAGEFVYLVTIYDESGLGIHVTCSVPESQLRIVNAGGLEMIGTQSRACAFSPADQLGPYVSDVFTTNTSSTLTAVSSFYFSALGPGAGNRYISASKNAGHDYDSPDAIILIAQQDANARLRLYSNLTNLATIDTPFGQRSASSRLAGVDSIISIGTTPVSTAFSAIVGFNRVIIAGYSSAEGYSGTNDRHMEHVVWQSDLGATDTETIRAEQEAFYA